MKYFAPYIEKDSDDIDISVHCDIYVFDWLFKYMLNKENPPQLRIIKIILINRIIIFNIYFNIIKFFKNG